ncbi:MAG: UvrD-helicase domain-containing protein, partial [Acidimicrobiia bacterium]
MNSDLIDEGVRRRIAHDGLDELLFVEAGAGTGKTKQLVDRVVSLVLRRGVSMREIAAVTFTEAAASELRSRIREAFERHLHDPATDPTDRARGEAALNELDSAAIGTVHSFAQRILGEHPVEAGLPPNVEVLDEVESLLEFGRRWQEQVDRMFATVALAPVITFARLLDVRIDHERVPSLREVAAVFSDNWDRLDPLVDIPVFEPVIERDKARIAIAGFGPIFGRCSEIADDKLAARILGFRDDIDRMHHVLAHGSDRDLVRHLAAKRKSKKSWVAGNLGAAAAWGGKEAKAEVVEQVRGIEAELDAVFEATADAVLRVLAGEVARFTVRSAHERRREGRLEFHDLLVFARQLLRDHAEARASLHQRYTRLLIDEFQDTDPIQVELATLIAASVTDLAPGTGWAEVPVDPERLFFVGDPKQSIYRFRRADIELFLAARDRFAGESVRLTTNFRTVAPVLDWVNHVFGALMAEEIPGRRPRYEPLAAHRDGDGGDHSVTLLGGPHAKDEDLRASALRELEAHTVADAVAAILAAPDAWPVEGPDGWRPARPEDIAILVPTRTSLSGLMDALRERGVDFRAETGTLVYETQEIRDLLSVLRAVAYGTDAVALVAALRSPMLGCGDDDLVAYAHAGGRWDLAAPRPDLPAAHPVMSALAFLDSLRAARWWTAPSALIEWIVRERHVMSIGLAERRARDGWRRIRFFVDQARLFESSQSADLVAFVAWAELQRSEMARVHEPLLPEADDHAVRIMTIHGAKGLEFPITVVSGLTTRMTARRNRFHVR